MGTFRDQLSTVNKEGQRLWLYVKAPKGRLTLYRTLMAYACIALLVLTPFVKINGHPLLLLNILERKFVILGKVFWPQDFYILAFVLLTFFVFIILFTAIFGRVWCGWACPQTIFMEMVFRKVEYWIEGDAKQQKLLAKMPWDGRKIFKKVAKFSAFGTISLGIGHLVMCYLLGYEEVVHMIWQGQALESTAFWGVLGFSALFMFVFSYLREQACTIICPYGRLQSVLIYKATVAVAYDPVRGEPRGKKGHSTGDCVDCSLCVQVCPTGIDIRNGIQLECINCTACIDACDEVMAKVQRPKGLIRFDSQEGIMEGKRWRLSPRIYAYSALLGVLLVSLSAFLWTRKNMDAHLLRVPGQTYQVTPTGSISNLYHLQTINKSFEGLPIQLQVRGLAHAKLQLVGSQALFLPADSAMENVVLIEVPQNEVTSRASTLYVDLISNGKVLQSAKVAFLGPIR